MFYNMSKFIVLFRDIFHLEKERQQGFQAVLCYIRFLNHHRVFNIGNSHLGVIKGNGMIVGGPTSGGDAEPPEDFPAAMRAREQVGTLSAPHSAALNPALGSRSNRTH